ncbi:MAG: TetR/AcrR family transcriptional regulator [Deltaproteobacteria bacterium]|nr:TetR/AcrR family transcriptional regulator [Deltaproteobacteria bacterium]
MPRALTEAERDRVLERLYSRGRDRFMRLGLTKTTVAGLAQDAGIGKGSFYQFFASKELLFLAICNREEQSFRDALLEDLDGQSDGREAITLLLRAAATRLEHHPFLRMLLDPATVSALVLRVDPRRMAENQEGDREFFVAVARGWIERGWLRSDVDPVEVFHALSGLFLIALQRDLIGSPSANAAMDTIIAALRDRWSPSGP